ncbi:fumarylacetoacetate hydrolase family protein [Kineosporia succinea]|uniref:2-keto-4-pentenoate hydratase/2-oxohepta-3-ene-1,7-dioic acid hydratase in catechol pathway/regulator of RNase E activity RraA n=1 Tax=Kineosporia succinea TaxID=84632 RepID=A0ABT9PFL4_9ACTN|nr:fumarylacetoacetate hydrolase family protein [Kineosporia succinea]MDP9830765.1 2-keto-4-pentenoate hydratase/2-oxohepta-3-ene-1,7-dioic acid hydratase in catechol pathway/regulator of RNase E activity RraA [Kineosporia succinea]
MTALPRPGKIIALHLNYPSRVAQRGRRPAFPSFFLKPPSSVSASGDTIERPHGTELLAYEGEIALIIGRTVRRVSPEEGWAAVEAVTAANDWGVYDLRAVDKGSNLRNKGGDGFTPLGPTVIPARDLDPDGLRVRTWVNGELTQDDTTADLLFPFGVLVADLSQLITLEPGDVVLTGTPAGSSVAVPGDVVEVEVDVPGGLTTGRLVTRVVEGTVPFADFGAGPTVNDLQRAEAWGSAEAAGLEPVLTDELRGLLNGVAVATLSSELRKRGYPHSSIDGVHPLKPGTRMIGTARTLRFVAHRPDLFTSHGGGYNAQKRAFDSLKPGEVLVIEARGDATAGTVGDVLALRAQTLGAAGVITDGAVRDSAAVVDIGLPVFAQGAHPSVLGRRHVPWEVDATVTCGGATVQPGDILAGDDDGVVVIPPHLLDEVARAASEQEAQDAWVAARVAEGHPVDGLFPPDAEWLARYRSSTRPDL